MKWTISYGGIKTKYAVKEDTRKLWLEFIKYQMHLHRKHGKRDESPFLDKKLYEEELNGDDGKTDN